MSNEKTIMGANKIVSLEEVIKDKGAKEPVFSKGLYHWVMFILSLYTRVKEKLNIDFEAYQAIDVANWIKKINGEHDYILSGNEIDEQNENINTSNIFRQFNNIFNLIVR